MILMPSDRFIAGQQMLPPPDLLINCVLAHCGLDGDALSEYLRYVLIYYNFAYNDLSPDIHVRACLRSANREITLM